jgi:hypothetical protein
LFNALACKPAVLLTPTESRRTTIVKTRLIIKYVDVIDSRIPIDVASAQTHAEWLEGIPPVLHRTVSIASHFLLLLFFFFNKKKNNLKIWAIIKLETVDKKILLVNKDLMASAAVIFLCSIKARKMSRGRGVRVWNEDC